ncbi:MAG TPA: methyltransferase [Candidatus Tectomicrobia bacterium]
MVDPVVPGAWRLTLSQGPGGYRFSLDAFLLADFVSATAHGPLLDLGTGCGVVALFLARRFPQTPIVGLELQASLVAMARQNVLGNALERQVAMVQADARCAQRLFPAGAFGTVVCNPPYRAVGSGRLNPNPEKAMARHELTLTLAQLIQACQHLLAHGGLLTMVYHPARLPELCSRLEAARLRLRRLRLVHSTLQAPASLVLIEAVQEGRDALTVLPPLYVYEARGRYTAEMQAIFQGRALGIDVAKAESISGV